MELEHRIIFIYLRIEEIYKKITLNNPLRKGGFQPALSDVEVLTMEIVGEMEGRNGDRAIWRYFDEHWHSWFPELTAYKTFAKHCANLCWIKQRILPLLFPPTQDIHIIDGVPMPTCHNARAYRYSSLREDTAWGYCAAKDEHYYGFKGHVTIGGNGFISDFTLTPANIDERQVLPNLIGKIKGLLIGDKGLLSKEWQEILAQNNIDLQTPLRKNMNDTRPRKYVKVLMRIRKAVETTLSTLTGAFSITKIKAHNMWHFMSKLYRKIIAYNFYIELKS